MNKTVRINGIEYNTYACLCDAQVYNNAILKSNWQTFEENDQAKLLVMATRKIDSYSYAGEKVDENQPLKFPRIMSNGKVSDDNVLTNLCLQIATYYCDNGSGNSASSDFINSVENYQIGDLHVKFKDDATLDLSGLDDLLEKALADWMTNQGMQIWL